MVEHESAANAPPVEAAAATPDTVLASETPARSVTAETATASQTADTAPAGAKAAPLRPRRRSVAAAVPAISETAREVQRPTSASKGKDTVVTQVESLKTDLNAMVANARTRAMAAYGRSGEVVGKAGELAKDSLEAAASSGKNLGLALKELGEESVAEARTVLETFGDDLKAFAGVKSPADLFLLQGRLAARNYQTAVALTAKNGSALRDLAGKVFAPLAQQAKANLAAVRPAK